MRKIISIRIDENLLTPLKEAGVNISNFINNILYLEMKKKQIFEEAVKKAEAERLKKDIIEEIRVIGAINNIDNRIREMSKLEPMIQTLLIKRNIKLLEEQRKLIKSDDLKILIDKKIKQLKNIGGN